LFVRNAIHCPSHQLLIRIGSTAHEDVVTGFQVFQLKFLRLLLPFLPLAKMGLVIDYHGLGCPVGPLDFEAIYAD